MEQELPKENLTLETEPHKKSRKLKFPFSKTILIPAVILLLVIIGAVAFYFSGRQATEVTPKTAEELAREQVENLPGTILFEPATLQATPGQRMSVDITMNTGGHAVYGVVLALKYNPDVIENVQIQQFKDPTSAISSTIEVSGTPLREDGAILTTLKLPAGTPALKGVGKIATISFVPKRINVAIPASYIQILPLTNFIRPDGTPEIRVTTNTLMLQYE